MSDPAGALVCGFSDRAAGLGGVAWSLGGGGGLLLSDDGVQEAELEVSGDDDGLGLRLKSAAGETEATLTPRTGRLALEAAGGSPAPGGRVEGAICTAKVKRAGQPRTLECFGHLSSWAEDPANGVGAFRHLAIERSDGSLLLVIGRGESGAEHGTEETAAWLLDREGGFTVFGETLLSTQYDKDGQQTRVGAELWPGGDEAPPLRAAGTRLGGTGAADGLSAALLRCSSEGSEGLGSYVIRRG